MKNNLIASIAENSLIVVIFVLLIAVTFIAARLAENYVAKKSGTENPGMNTRKIVIIGIFSAISAILMLFEIPMPFAPSFYKLDLSDLPAVIGGFAFGPMTGVMIEFIKILLNLIINGTQTAFIGELANFIVGCSYVLPASIIYIFRKNRQTAFISCLAATMIITIVGSSLNAFYLLPAFAKLYGMPLDALIGMGTAINPAINNMFTFVLFAVAPINLLKGGVLSGITVLVYKKLSPVLKNTSLVPDRKREAESEA
ncbi:ECF transporter S component [Butyrivibrio sp. AE3004]|uniref:ECF transporter S component n=1 Tax=Butyrivibrio sp. AE3004 TaxID=1506994 RepID=UPI000493F051|nr:ECF transporter S component [Butyrivibrio sp. AE3004]